MRANTAKVVDLFCGCGGFSLGAHEAGLSPSLAVDVDPILTSSFRKNFPKTKLLLADIAGLSGSHIERVIGGPADIVFGGPPCQGFSSIGKRLEDDPRRALLSEFFRVVNELQPAYFIMENVRGLATESGMALLNLSLSQLTSNYKILGPIAVDAADFGAATRRPRLFVIGANARKADPVSLTDLEKYKKNSATVRDAIKDIMGATAVGEKDGFDFWKISHSGRPSAYASRLRAKSGMFTGNTGTTHTRAVIKRFKSVAPGRTDPVGRHHKLDWSGQCPTLRAGTGSDKGSFQSVRPLHPSEPRVITVREAARLQGFPDDFLFHPTTWHSFRMIGNSVSPIASSAIFSMIKEKIEGASLMLAAE